jgi:precorrin-4 methylase
MQKLITLGAAILMAAAIVPVFTIGISSADAPTAIITRATWHSEKEDAVAKVLNTTPSAVQTALKDKSLKTLVSNAGFTRQTFREKVKAELEVELEGMGYSKSTIHSYIAEHHGGMHHTKR